MASLLFSVYPRCRLICAWGEDGAWGKDKDGTLHHSPGFPPERIVETLAAGDTFNAGIVFSLVNGNSLQSSLLYACRLAGFKCGIQGLDVRKFVHSWQCLKELTCLFNKGSKRHSSVSLQMVYGVWSSPSISNNEKRQNTINWGSTKNVPLPGGVTLHVEFYCIFVVFFCQKYVIFSNTLMNTYKFFIDVI